MRSHQFIGFVFALFISLSSYAQSDVYGIVYGTNKLPLSYVSIYVPDANIGATSDDFGNYKLENLPDGNYKIVASFLGFASQEKNIELTGSSLEVNFLLTENISQLKEVVLNGKSKSEVLRETAYRPEVLELQNIQQRATPVIALVGQLSGVHIRQQGGLGSDANIMINGVSGKGIKTFIDGIPLDFLGKGYDLKNISPNLIKQIEVYKGVTPISFGSDALGGVVNIETQNRYEDYVDVSYTVGSWNTHQLGLGLKKYLNSNKTQYLQLDGYFNYSDNDYWMDDVDIVVDELNNTKKGRAKRFNDQYRSHLVRLQYGFQQVSWADDFKFLLSTSLVDKEWQHGITAIIPWGEVISQNKDINSLVSWRKNSFQDKFLFSITAGYNQINSKFVDVASKTYYWDGSFTPKVLKGESGFYLNGRTPNITTDVFFARGNTNYKINNKYTLNFTGLVSSSELKGSDTAGTASFKEDFYANPQSFIKTFAGVSLESHWFRDKSWGTRLKNGQVNPTGENKRITNVLSGKHYWLKSKIAGLKGDNSFDTYTENNTSSFGFGDVLKINWLSNLSSHFAYEYTLRLPDGDELFGDGINIGPNPYLIPERNHNLNIGIQYKFLEEKVKLDINGFYRETKNAIFLNAISRGLSGYFNLLETSGSGVEVSVKSTPIAKFGVFGNATWQKITLKEPDSYGQIEKRHIGSRIPNSPYLFANIGASYKIADLFLKESSLEFSYNGSYVHEFFRSWENDAINDPNKAKTPTQFLHNTSIGYVFPNYKYSLFLECRNLTDQKAYDNFMVQKPGRSFYLKLRMFIN